MNKQTDVTEDGFTPVTAQGDQLDSDFALAQKARGGDRKAERDFIRRHMGLVKAIASSVFLSGARADWMELGDLEQEGLMGLLEAMKVYQEDATFRTFASHRIRGAMIDAIRRSLYVGRAAVKHAQVLEKTRNGLSKKLLREPTIQEWKEALPENLRQKFEEIKSSMTFADPTRLYVLDDKGQEVELPDIAVATCSPTLEDSLLEEEYVAVQNRFGSVFKEASQEVLTWTEREVFRLLIEENLTFRDIGEQLGFSESRACQLVSDAAARVRRYLKACYPEEVSESLQRLREL